jgi:membrane associated rhomboid family serine protease
MLKEDRMDNESKPVDESLVILEESQEWDDYLASDEAYESELKKKREALPTYLESKPDKGKFTLPLNIFIIMFLCSLFRWESAIPYGLEASYNSVFVEGQYYRLLSSLFIHADLAHLFGNGWIFLVFAFLLYNYYGALVFPAMSFICGIATTAVTIYFYPPNTRLLGASGMIYSMVAMWLVFFLKFDTRYSFFIRLVRAVAFILVILFPS